jgi:PAS domain S-box-containing protein
MAVLSPLTGAGSEPKVSILLVDDKPGNLLALRAILDDMGHNLVEARSGEEALRRLEDDDFAVVLLDVQMPGLDGFEAAKIIRSQKRSRHTPIIFISAYDSAEFSPAKAYSLGAVDFLTKPLVPEILRAKVAALIELVELAQQARRQSEQLRLLIEGTKDYAIFMLDPGGHIVTWNAAAERINGYRADEIIGRHFSCFYSADDIERGKPERELVLAEINGKYEEEGWRLRKDGSRFWASMVLAALRDEAGDLQGFSNITRDMTERMQAEDNARRLHQEESARRAAETRAEAARESEQRFRLMANSAPVLIWISGTDKRYQWLNEPWLTFTGRSMEQELGNGWTEGVHAEDLEGCLSTYSSSFDARKPFMTEFRLRRHDGVYRWVIDHGVPLYRPDGAFTGYIGSCLDITDRREDEQEKVRLLGEVSRRSRQLEVLSGASQLVNAVLDVQVVIRTLVASAMELVEAESGAAGVLRNGKMTFSEYHTRGTIEPLDLNFGPEDESGIPSWVMRNKKPYITNDAAHDANVRQEIRERLGVYNLIHIPIFNRQGDQIACFQIHNKRERRPFGEEDLAALQALASGTAIALENARLLEEVRDADRRKDEFLAMLAHELRNPLAPIRNAVQVMKSPQADRTAVEHARQITERQVQHMVRLVDDLLDVSRIMRGKIELRKEPVELSSVIARGIETAQPAIDAQGQQLIVSLPSEPLRLDADPTRFAQVVGNLLNNAAKFSVHSGRIWLTAQREGSEAVVRVRDEGAGIRPDLLPHIFDLFVQGDRSLERTQGGLGIGLTVVQKLIEMHGGTVTAHSAGLGRGTEFVVRLPCLEAAPRQQPTRAPSSVAGGSVSRRVLVVDDNVDAAESVGILLKMWGHEVRLAHTGPDALRAAEGYQPEVVLLDIGLPGMNGYEVAKHLRQEPQLTKTKLIAVTGYGQEEDRRRSKDAGFDHHLTKPVELDALHALLER